MKMYCIILILAAALSVCLQPVGSIDPISSAVLAGSAVFAGITFISKPLFCYFNECCSKSWIHNTTPGLEDSIKTQLYGQHLVLDTVLSAIDDHLNHEPKQALVFSFHGPTGTGKNHLSKIIAEHLYKKGFNSNYVHLFSGTKDFSRRELTEDYKDQVRDWIRGNVSDCARQLFMFDEVEKMEPGIVDVIKPFAEPSATYNGVDYTKSIYLLLSNIGGEIIVKMATEIWDSGQKRDEITLDVMEQFLVRHAHQVPGGLQGSTLISKAIISHHVPFLPLEVKHVRQCILDEFARRGHHSVCSHVIDDVLTHLPLFPDDTKVFSQTGCKRISQKVSLVIHQHKNQHLTCNEE